MDYTKTITPIFSLTTEDIAQAIGDDEMPSDELIEHVTNAIYENTKLQERLSDIILSAVEDYQKNFDW